MNKKESKFKFVDVEETKSESTSDALNVEIVETPKTVSIDRSDDKEDYREEKVSIDKNKLKGHHLSFELRVLVMILLILMLFCGACLLVVETLKVNKTKVIKYDEVSSVDYQVCLNGEDGECLEEENVYDSSTIKNVNTTFDYNINFSKPTKYNLAYHVSAITTIRDKKDLDKIVYRNEKVLVDRTEIYDTKDNLNVYKTVTYDYLTDNKYVIDYKDIYNKEYIADVEIGLFIEEEGKEEAKKVASVTLPFISNSLKAKKYNVSSVDNELEIKEVSWDKYTIICATIASILVLISLVLIYKTAKLVLKVTNNRSKYQTRLLQILRDYDRIIVIARDGYESNKDREIVKLDSFDKLLDIKDNLSKPIIFSKINDSKCEFIVEDDEKLYKYVLKDDEI